LLNTWLLHCLGHAEGIGAVPGKFQTFSLFGTAGREQVTIAFRSIGFVGKLFGEAIEEANRGPIEALTASGAPRSMLLVKGYWPQVSPAFWSVALLRWDINIRESAVLGLVGAGGIGVALDSAMNNLYWDQVGLILAIIFTVVIITEIVTSAIRSRIL
jgi:phosphonate transport system permease protein